MPDEHPGGSPTAPRSRRWLRVAIQLGVIFLGIHFLLPQLAGLEATGEALARVTWWILALVLLCEVVSFACYGELELVILRAGGADPPRNLIQRSTVVGFSLGRTLPGGSTTALAVVVHALRSNGVDAATATAALAASGAVSSLVLAALLPIGAAIAILAGGVVRGALGVAAAGVVIAVVVGLIPLVVRNPDRAAGLAVRATGVIARGPLRGRLRPEVAGEGVRRGLGTIVGLTRRPKVLAAALGFATGNWLLDFAALTLVALTVGRGTPLAGLLLAYVIAQLATSVPITPGGVGVVETVMTASLVGAGAPAAAATATVLGWRLISHWLPVLVGLAVLPTLSVPGLRHR